MTVPRVLFQGGSGSTLRVSLPGWDVTAADIDHLVFNSSYSGMSPIKRGSIACSIRGSAAVYWDTTQEKIPWVLFRCKLPSDARYFGPYIYKGLKSVNDYIMATVTVSYISFSVYQPGVDSGCILDYIAFKNTDPT